MPKGLVLFKAHRIEDRDLWARYSQKRAEIASTREDIKPVKDMPGSGEVKTTKWHRKLSNRLATHMNELYLFHGSSPTGALGIGEEGFMLKFAGSHAGTMFGNGAYFAESSSKSDEYASGDQTGVF